MGRVAIFGSAAELGPDLTSALMRFRKRLFVDIYQWDLSVTGDEERDQFDHRDAAYLLLMEGRVIIGTFRAIRTDKPYLAATVFPQLACVVPYPARPDVWEISRFGVVADRSYTASALTFALMFDFAHAVGAHSLVAITDPAFERAMRRLGIRTRRYGPPAAIGCDRHGRVLHGVAGEIPLAWQHGEKFRNLLSLTQTIEIDDVSDFLGRRRIPA